VGTSRVLPRYRHYAPGLDPDQCQAGVHILDLRRGREVGGVPWPTGNQLFAIEAIDRTASCGFPFTQPRTPGRARVSIHCFSAGIAS
jgi:hypothetical protein